jgi:hypothetical protein
VVTTTYQRLDAKAGFGVYSETAMSDYLPYLTASNELKAQRKNFYSCIWYFIGDKTLQANNVLYSDASCKLFNFAEEYN